MTQDWNKKEIGDCQVKFVLFLKLPVSKPKALYIKKDILEIWFLNIAILSLFFGTIRQKFQVKVYEKIFVDYCTIFIFFKC